jgi:hypothetical protein
MIHASLRSAARRGLGACRAQQRRRLVAPAPRRPRRCARAHVARSVQHDTWHTTATWGCHADEGGFANGVRKLGRIERTGLLIMQRATCSIQHVTCTSTPRVVHSVQDTTHSRQHRAASADQAWAHVVQPERPVHGPVPRALWRVRCQMPATPIATRKACVALGCHSWCVVCCPPVQSLWTRRQETGHWAAGVPHTKMLAGLLCCTGVL